MAASKALLKTISEDCACISTLPNCPEIIVKSKAVLKALHEIDLKDDSVHQTAVTNSAEQKTAIEGLSETMDTAHAEKQRLLGSVAVQDKILDETKEEVPSCTKLPRILLMEQFLSMSNRKRLLIMLLRPRTKA